MAQRDRSGCRRRGELITTVIVWLLLGAIVNVIVAWACAILIDPYRATQPPPALGVPHQAVFAVRQVNEPWRGQWGAVRYRVPGMLRLDSSFNRAAPPWGPANEGPGAQPDIGDPALLVPRWSGLATPSDEFLASRREIERTIVDARGWPMLSLWHVPFEFIMIRVPDQSSKQQGRGGLALPLPPWRDPTPFSSRPSEPRTLPLRIIPVGFLVNSAFYAGVLWLVFAVPGVVRRRRRIRRGQCPACAYPVGSSGVCTECGKPVASLQRRTVE
jgi:hypothetical protein